jgi:DNA primase
MLAQGDPGEPKMKSRIVDAMLPLLSDIRDTVEREAYIQEIAMKLGIDPRVLQDRLRAMERAQAVRTQGSSRSTRPVRVASDLEAHVLTLVMQHPELRPHVDRQLRDLGLRELDETDFQLQYRLIWSSWNQLSEHPELGLEDFLPSDMLETVQAWVAEPLPEGTLSQRERDVLRTVLRIREKQLQQRMQETRSTLMMAQSEGDVDAVSSITRTIQLVSDELRSIQWALAQRLPRE